MFKDAQKQLHDFKPRSKNLPTDTRQYQWQALIALVLMVCGALFPFTSTATTADELRSNIADHNSQISALEQEIAQYQKQIDATGKERQTLEQAVKQLTLTGKKLLADIKLTEQRITATQLSIQELSLGIQDKEGKIDQQRAGLAESVRLMNQQDTQSLAEIALGNNSLSDVWNEIADMEQFQGGVRASVESLQTLRTELVDTRTTYQSKQKQLSGYRADLAAQKQIVDANTREQNALLATTKNKESNYKALLADRQQRKDALEQELRSYEDQLRITIDPNSLPHTGSGVLTWPVTPVKITQYFGNTPFASQNPQVYNGKGHNGVDFAASIGTPVKAALGGTITAVGNTDPVCPNASYGKWVLIRHNNGLSSLYAHLSIISVQEGDAVGTGTTVGYSGNTGYSTGPHLHFTVYATAGMRVSTLKSKVCSGTYTIPIADQSAYLNPLSYL